MELIITNKFMSLKGSYYVKDIDQKDVMVVKGKFFTVTSKKFIKDLNNKLKFIVRNKFWRLFRYSAYVYDAKRKKVAVIRRKAFSMADHFYVQSNLGNIEIKGAIFQRDYQIYLNGVEIGSVTKQLSVRESFLLKIDDKFDSYTFVALVIAIDNINDRRMTN